MFRNEPKNIWKRKLFYESERLITKYMGTTKWAKVEERFNRIQRILEKY